MVDAGRNAGGLPSGRHRVRLSHAPSCRRRTGPARGSGLGLLTAAQFPGLMPMGMSWQVAALLLLGGSTALLFLGMPVALSFVAINIVGAALFLGGDPG